MFLYNTNGLHSFEEFNQFSKEKLQKDERLDNFLLSMFSKLIQRENPLMHCSDVKKVKTIFFHITLNFFDAKKQVWLY